MKLFATISFLIVFLLLSVTAFAQIQHHGININIDEGGRAFVELTITFAEPETSLRFDVMGKVENFNATSIAGPIDCNLEVSGISSINCILNLTQEKRTVDISFETNDFVRTFDNKFYLDSDFSLNRGIEQLFAFVKLPEGTVLAGKLSFPENVTTSSDGRRIIISWDLNNIQSNQPLRLQVLYERTQQPPLLQLRLRHFVVFGVAAAIVISVVYLRYFRRPEKLVLSVLDDYERKVMDMLVASDGVVNQKKVVQETNLSKAKVSRIVKNLVERGLVEVERMGRRNKLKLVKKKFKL